MNHQSPPKTLNITLYIVLSLIPFLGYYPFVKLKKARRILLVNIPLGIMSLIVLLFVDHMIGQLMNYILLPSVDAFLVWIWVKAWNKNLNTNVLVRDYKFK